MRTAAGLGVESVSSDDGRLSHILTEHVRPAAITRGGGRLLLAMSLGRRLGVPPTAAGAAAEEEAVWPQIGTSAMGDRVPGGGCRHKVHCLAPSLSFSL